MLANAKMVVHVLMVNANAELVIMDHTVNTKVIYTLINIILDEASSSMVWLYILGFLVLILIIVGIFFYTKRL